jgi:xanthine dehydrogenase large subunit
MLESAANREETIHRSKAVGEPPLMLSLSVFYAIRDAVASVGGKNSIPGLQSPATPESVLNAVLQQRSAS